MNGTRKYFFGFLVAAYFITSLGLPVYLHYCAGELEEVSYYLQADSCCDGEVPADDDCCKNEDLYLINLADVISKSAETFQPIELTDHSDLLFTIATPGTSEGLPAFPGSGGLPPPKLQHSLLISTTILRI
jgi:hypothetical protein